MGDTRSAGGLDVGHREAQGEGLGGFASYEREMGWDSHGQVYYLLK
jgi:hypothetical protein